MLYGELVSVDEVYSGNILTTTLMMSNDILIHDGTIYSSIMLLEYE